MKFQTIILMLVLSAISTLSIAGVVERNVRRDDVYLNEPYRNEPNIDVNSYSSTQVDVNGNERTVNRNMQYDNSGN